MCGIAGFLGDFTEAELRGMTRRLAHRGPDDEGFHLDGPVGLGHRRLSIIDIATGQQPMSNEDGTVWIVYNGETYNFRQLRKQYLSGHEFKTSSDTEVILHLYEEFGEACVEHLRGMFAFAIWDSRRRRLFLARDRFGIKPLYYSRTPRGLVFASEAKALLGPGLVRPEIDTDSISPYLTFRYVPGAATMFRGIRKLEPATTLTVEGERSRETRYWELDFSAAGREGVDRHAERLTELLREAVELRLISEVPLGAYLSGGLDSSFIVGLMSGLQSDPVETFTVGLDGSWHDESSHARTVAEAFSTNHHELRVSAEAEPVLDRVVWHLDEPLGDAATVPTYLMSELTRRYVTVVLSGEGADELLAGYSKYKAVLFGTRLRQLLGTGVFRLAARGVRGITADRVLAFLATADPADAYLDLAAVFNDREKRELLGPELRGGFDGCPSRELVQPLLGDAAREAGPLNRLMTLDVATWLPNDVLLKNDKMTMAHSLEARVPFLDHPFAEYLASIPENQKLRGLREKYVLRRAMEPIVPREIVRRKKHGFTVPVADWLKTGLRGRVERLLDRRRIESAGFWNYDYLRSLTRRDLSNEYYRRQLWTILAFEMWHEVFIENSNGWLTPTGEAR